MNADHVIPEPILAFAEEIRDHAIRLGYPDEAFHPNLLMGVLDRQYRGCSFQGMTLWQFILRLDEVGIRLTVDFRNDSQAMGTLFPLPQYIVLIPADGPVRVQVGYPLAKED